MCQLLKEESRWKATVDESRPEDKPFIFICSNCSKDCRACISLLSHSKKCDTLMQVKFAVTMKFQSKQFFFSLIPFSPLSAIDDAVLPSIF